tara:strand:+ start:102 stop:455 length:354 start_codon:yes stop_codon:yes gene_type:complete
MAKVSSSSTTTVSSSGDSFLSFTGYDPSADTDLTVGGVNVQLMNVDASGNVTYSDSTPNFAMGSVTQYTNGVEVSYTITGAGYYRITLSFSYCDDGDCSGGSGDPHIRTLDGKEYML